MGDMDFREVDRLSAQINADLRRTDAMCRQIDRMLADSYRTVLNKSWMDTVYPLPQPEDTFPIQPTDVRRRAFVGTGGYSGGTGGYGGRTDAILNVLAIGLPISGMILGAIIGAFVGSEYPYFYGFVGVLIGPFIGFALFIIGAVIYGLYLLLASLIEDIADSWGSPR